MKNKKGFVIAFLPILWLVLVIMILVLLIWFGYRISAGLSAFWNFLTIWWWAIGLSITGFLFRNEIRMLLRRILRI